MKIVISFLLLLFSILGKSQDIMVDRNGEDVLLYYVAATNQFSLSSGKPALKLARTIALYPSFWFIDANNNNKHESPEIKTVAKSHAISVELQLSSTDDYLFLTNLNDLKPAFKAEVGYQNSVDTIYNIDAIRKGGFSAKPRGISFFLNMDNTKLYNTIKLSEKHFRPVSIGAHAHISIIKFRWCLPSFSALVQNTWNKSDLIKYRSTPEIGLQG